MALLIAPLAPWLAACSVLGPTTTTSPLGVVPASPLALEFLADREVTIEEIRLARDAAERCAAAQGVGVEVVVTEQPNGAVELSYELKGSDTQVVDRCFQAHVGPLMDFRAWVWDGLDPETALERTLRGR